MAERVLVTGGAGFIGRHVVRALVQRGHRVRVLDSLIEQVHGTRGRAIPGEADFVNGDVRDRHVLARALTNVDSVIHLAAEVGVGQSMYAIERYVSTNDLGSAALFEELINRQIRRVVVASSMSIYGEGLYRTRSGDVVQDAVRTGRSADGHWDPVDAEGAPLAPMPTPEWKSPSLQSVYALTKFVQERMTLVWARAYGVEGVALRLFNVFGPGQALSNPYTGVLAIFGSRLLNGERPMVFEDGEQRRDFVHVEDVAEAFCLALERPGIAGEVFNIGSGQDITINEVARQLAEAMGRPELEPEVTGKVRTGDIRHCFADVTRAREVLGFEARRDFRTGIEKLVSWLAGQRAHDRVMQAREELEARGLVA